MAQVIILTHNSRAQKDVNYYHRQGLKIKKLAAKNFSKTFQKTSCT